MLRKLILLALAVLFIAAFAGLMLTKTLPYYTFEKGIHFLTTQSDYILRPSARAPLASTRATPVWAGRHIGRTTNNGPKSTWLNAKVVGRKLLTK